MRACDVARRRVFLRTSRFMPDQISRIAAATEFTLAGLGCVLLWAFCLRPRLRREPPISTLQPVEASLPEFMFFLLHVLGGGFFGSVFASLVGKPLGIDGERLIILSNGLGQLGMLGGILLFAFSFRRAATVARSGGPIRAFSTGIATFLIALPFVFLTGFLWTALLEFCGLPVEKQLAVELFGTTTAKPWLIAFGAMAVVLAPTVEELVFRAGFFRYLRTRIPRWAALVGPACVFGALHNNLASLAQLVVLGVIFSVAYERTGQIGTAIVAHALFNLNMVILLLSGVAV